MKDNPLKKDRIVKEYDSYDTDSLTDVLMIIMTDIEDALLQAGAEPGKDYNYRDLMNWAIPFQLRYASKGES